MTPATIIQQAAADGVNLALSPAGTIKATGEQATVNRWLSLIRANKAALLAALAYTPEHAHAHGPAEHPEPDTVPSPGRVAGCMRCRNLTMRCEIHEGTTRVFWWRFARGHALMEGRNYGERVLLAPTACGAAGDFRQWQMGQR